jgi:hypothetical protein
MQMGPPKQKKKVKLQIYFIKLNTGFVLKD